jgi:signal transduction histidine kinase
MKIKYRITFLFSLLVVGIMLFFCVAVYSISEYNRERAFQTRLRNRSISTVRIFTQIKEIDKELLRRIEESTMISLENKKIEVYNDKNELEYSYADKATDTTKLPHIVLDEARKYGEHYFTLSGRKGYAVYYTASLHKYVVVTQALDKNGIIQMKQLRWVLITCFLLGILVVVITGYYFSTKLVKPIATIINEVNEITSQDLSKRIQAGPGEDELQQLARTFNQLLNRLEESFHIQRRFISNASHELSTPMASIASQLEVSLQKDRSTEEYKSVMQSINDDVQQLSKLTRGLLEMAKAGTEGSIKLSEIRVDEVLMKIPADIGKIHTDYSVQLQFSDFPENELECMVFGNSDLLYSAIKNIVENACKYSNDKMADITLQFGEGVVKVEVRDNGLGIPENEIPFVFQPFYRGSDAQTTKGFGLGLSMANRIIRLHKGKIEVRSELNKGTMFTIIIPSMSSLRS